MKRVFLYGLAGAEDRYKIVKYVWINCDEETDIIKRMRNDAGWMKFQNPSIEHVYAISEGAQLANAYKYTKRRDSIESNVNFKLILETQGLLII